MNLHEIFAKPVDRYIEGVIKADDLESLKLEVEEYVITNEIAKRLETFLAAYNDYKGANGVWISGFFGSGKSHLLKMLALLLENQTIDGSSMLEMFQPKCDDNAILQGAMAKAVAIPSQSILFNVDQKAVAISKEEIDAVLHVFVKVFNEMQGYYGKLGYVAEFERHLDERGKYEEFKNSYRQIADRPWEAGREQVILEKENVDKAYAAVEGEGASENLGIIDKYRQDYQVSIEDFALMVKAYIDTQEKGFRLNFFVDEVGQYVADHIKLMTNLQTIAESLATICGGQAWLIVTAQEEMETVMGQFVTAQRDDFTKIMDRFKTRMKLTSANVDEVIKRRLLEKTDQAVPLIEKIYSKEKNNFGTVFGFSDETMRYQEFRSKEDFVSLYPFVPYQFTLFQSSLENLSRKNAFEGQHRSVGERSMLGVFQQVVIQIAEQEVGTLATFDRMFEGIRTALKAQTQRSIINAEGVMEEFDLRMLKALFLVKYIKEFKATPRNLRVLLQDRFDLDFNERKERIQKSLDYLESHNFIQRKGNEYEYLTDEERDVQKDIDNTHIDESELTDEIQEIVFNEVITHRKLRYEPTSQDFVFTKKVDERIIGRERELSIHLITPLNDHINDPAVLQGYSMGKAEMMVVFPEDGRLISDLYAYKKTDKYIRQSRNSGTQDTVQIIIDNQRIQNQRRHQDIRKRIQDLLKDATIIVSGNEIDVNGGDPLTRIHNGFTRLIQTTYPNLKMIQGIQYRETDISQYLEATQNGLFADQGEQLSEAENELLSFIKRNKNEGLRTSIKKIENEFSTKPYGWYLAAIQCILAKLCGLSKVEMRSDGNLLEGNAVERALLNTQNYQNVLVTPQTEFTPQQIRNLKEFYGAFFARPPEATDARSLGRETKQGFLEVMRELEQMLVEKDRYPFLAEMEKVQEELKEISKETYEYFLTEFLAGSDSLLEWKESLIDPLRHFMRGPNRKLFDEIRGYLVRQEANFKHLDSELPEELKELLLDPECFQGNRMRDGKQHLDALKKDVDKVVQKENDQAVKSIQDMRDQFENKEKYQNLPAELKDRFKDRFEGTLNELESLYLVAVIRQTVDSFKKDAYTRMLSAMENWAPEEKPKPGDPKPKKIEYISRDDLDIGFEKMHLETEQDVENYLSKLKKSLLAALKKGKRIQL